MNRESLRQTLRVHVMRLRQQQQRQQQDAFAIGCTVDELVCQVEGVLSTEKPDFGFGEALARLQFLMNGAATPTPATATATVSTSAMTALPTMPSVPHRRGSIGSGTGRRGSISEIIDADAMISRHSLKTIA